MKIIYYTWNNDLCMSTLITLNNDVYAKKIFNVGFLKVFDLKMNVFALMKDQNISKGIFDLVTSSRTELKIVHGRTSGTINERLIQNNLIFISEVICFFPNSTFLYSTNFVLVGLRNT